MVEENKRLEILNLIESGDIGVEEGLRLLQELSQVDTVDTDAVSPSDEVEQVDDKTSTGEADRYSHISQLQEIPAPFADSTTFDEEVQEESAAQIDDDEVDSESTEEKIPFTEDEEVYSHTAPEGMPEGLEKWRRWWMIPLYIAIGITVLGGVFMLWAFQSSGMGFWFLCSSVFFAFGVIVLVLAAQSRNARWLHLRVKQKPGERPKNIAISFPLPMRLASWMIRVFGRFMPDMGGTSPDNILSALNAVDETVSMENPIHIEVDDENGEHVEIYIG